MRTSKHFGHCTSHRRKISIELLCGLFDDLVFDRTYFFPVNGILLLPVSRYSLVPSVPNLVVKQNWK